MRIVHHKSVDSVKLPLLVRPCRPQLFNDLLKDANFLDIELRLVVLLTTTNILQDLGVLLRQKQHLGVLQEYRKPVQQERFDLLKLSVGAPSS